MVVDGRDSGDRGDRGDRGDSGDSGDSGTDFNVVIVFLVTVRVVVEQVPTWNLLGIGCCRNLTIPLGAVCPA